MVSCSKQPSAKASRSWSQPTLIFTVNRISVIGASLSCACCRPAGRAFSRSHPKWSLQLRLLLRQVTKKLSCHEDGQPCVQPNPPVRAFFLVTVRGGGAVNSRPEIVCQVFFAVAAIEFSSGEPRRLSALR